MATAGHVDHGKSTLVQALTGTDPDRFVEEKRRGLTLDLGFAWTDLPSGRTIAFVDVPGHQRFTTTMLAGVGPVPAALLVVAADEGWRRQTGEHAAALTALGVRHGLLVVTRSDLLDPDLALAEAAERLDGTPLAGLTPVAVSAVTGEGMDDLRAALDALVDRIPAPDTHDPRVRLWVDRSFTLKGAGTVVTGTLAAGTLRTGDELELHGRRVTVRGLHSLGVKHDEVAAVARVAVNLRGVEHEDVSRGDALLAPGRWRLTDSVDLSVDAGTELPAGLVLHVGSAAVQARVRPLADGAVRLRLARPVPLVAGDRVLLRDPNAQHVLAGADVVDVDPPALQRRGAAARRGEQVTAGLDAAAEVRRRGAVRADDLVRLGRLAPGEAPPSTVARHGEWLVDPGALAGWRTALLAAVREQTATSPLDPGLPVEAARHRAGIPGADLVPLVVDRVELLELADGRVRLKGAAPRFSPAQQAALDALAARWRLDPLDAPEAYDVPPALTAPVLATAARLGLLLRLTGDVVVGPAAPQHVVDLLTPLPQPFSLSDARQAMGTTRRVAVPLLEELDRRGLTQRVDGQLRRLRPPV